MEFGQTVLLACWATSILTANSGLMFSVDNNATATNFDAVYFITETVVDVFDARAVEKMAAIGVEATYDVIRCDFIATTLFFM